MALTDDEVRYVADLARLALTDEERSQLQQQLSSILEQMAILDEVDTTMISPTAQVIETATVMRPDLLRPSLPREQVLANAPAAEDGYFRVEAVLE